MWMILPIPHCQHPLPPPITALRIGHFTKSTVGQSRGKDKSTHPFPVSSERRLVTERERREWREIRAAAQDPLYWKKTSPGRLGHTMELLITRTIRKANSTHTEQYMLIYKKTSSVHNGPWGARAKPLASTRGSPLL